jgi:hypothetical protein
LPKHVALNVPEPVLPVNCVTDQLKFVQLSCTDPLPIDRHVPASALLEPEGPVEVCWTDEHPTAKHNAATPADNLRVMATDLHIIITRWPFSRWRGWATPFFVQ